MSECSCTAETRKLTRVAVARRCLGCGRGIFSPLPKRNFCIDCHSRNASQPKRFQLHLSTCVTVVFTAAILLWANLTPTLQEWRGLKYVAARSADGARNENIDYRRYGFPLTAYNHMESNIAGTTAWADPFNAGKNVIFGVAVLCAIGALCELRIRRRRYKSARAALIHDLEEKLAGYA